MPLLPLTTTSVRSVIEQHFKFASIPNYTTLRDCNVNHSQLPHLKRALFNAFNINVEINLSDTVDSIHDKLLAKG